MNHLYRLICILLIMGMQAIQSSALGAEPFVSKTTVSIQGEDFLINGQPTYAGRTWRGHRIEGLLMNSRMVQGIFDDLNKETVDRWRYPDTGKWDAERNTREFIDAMPEWRRAGLLSFTLNLQGGSPTGYSAEQPWDNSAFTPDGSLRQDYLSRLTRILDEADRLGMVVILGYFYFGQDQRFRDEAAVVRAVDLATDWILERGYRNILIEVNIEADVLYDHDILKPGRVHELILRVQQRSQGRHPLLVSTSFGGGVVPTEAVAQASDFILIHGNGVKTPQDMTGFIKRTKAVPGVKGKPIVNNEDDHYDFDLPSNNFIASVAEHVSWGYFDYRMAGEGHQEGFQSVPVDWRISSPRKIGFFRLLAEMTGGRYGEP